MHKYDNLLVLDNQNESASAFLTHVIDVLAHIDCAVLSRVCLNIATATMASMIKEHSLSVGKPHHQQAQCVSGFFINSRQYTTKATSTTY